MSKKILLVEDDLILGETIQEILEDNNYIVQWVKDGQDALDKIFDGSFDLYLFDINVPFIQGLDLLKELRDSGDITPAIFITANVDIQTMKKGFDIGGDDYIKKPFDIDELLIRIEVVLKKSFKSYENIIVYNDLKYDIDNRTLTKNNNTIHISPSELMLFEFFIKNIGKTLSKEQLLSSNHDDFEGSDAVLRVQISKLKKLGLNIKNIRGVGYRCENLEK